MDIAQFENKATDSVSYLDKIYYELNQQPTRRFATELRKLPLTQLETALAELPPMGAEEVLRDAFKGEQRSDEQVAKDVARMRQHEERFEDGQRRHARMVAEELAAIIRASQDQAQQSAQAETQRDAPLKKVVHEIGRKQAKGVPVGEKRLNASGRLSGGYSELTEYMKGVARKSYDLGGTPGQAFEQIRQDVRNKAVGCPLHWVNGKYVWIPPDSRSKNGEHHYTEEQLMTRLQRCFRRLKLSDKQAA